MPSKQRKFQQLYDAFYLQRAKIRADIDGFTAVL